MKKQMENEWGRELRIVAGGKVLSYKVGSYQSKRLDRLSTSPSTCFSTHSQRHQWSWASAVLLDNLDGRTVGWQRK